jgi:hypothetical protein
MAQFNDDKMLMNDVIRTVDKTQMSVSMAHLRQSEIALVKSVLMDMFC